MGTRNTGIPATPGSSVFDGGAGAFTDNASYGFPEDGWVDRVFVYQGGHSANETYTGGVYRTDTGALVATTQGAGYGVGIGYNGAGFNLSELNNNNGYPSSNLYLWAGYGWCAGSLSSVAQNIGTVAGGGNGYYHVFTGSMPGNRVNGSLNPFGAGGAGKMAYYLEYFPTATVTAITGTPVGVGQSFTVTGRSFSAGGPKNPGGPPNVYVNGVQCFSVIVNSDTQLTCTVPAGATSGPVKVDTNAGTATSGSNLIVASMRGKKAGAWVSGQVYGKRTGAWHPASAVLGKKAGAWVSAS